ncbi:MAG: NADH-quinone oxidoreductase subunit J [Bacteroidia bacterium]|jgi:NADH-quinone oxidoreductase subunit J|nr:NADH-quinone oxidoreductase subunit J [Bacteroidia bacterium]
MSKIAFFVLAFLSIFSAMMVVFSRKPVHSVLSLIFCFFTIAGHYILLNAQFLAAVHIIVYAGAIMVLFLFVIMLLNLNAESEPHKTSAGKIAAVVSGGLLLLVLVSVLKSTDGLQLSASPDSQVGMVKNLGMVLYDKYMLPFEVSALLFLTAMIGATMIGKKELD